MSKFDCFHGMDCNKISVCRAEQMVEDATEEFKADNTRLRENMKKMIERWRRQMIERWRKEMIDYRGYEDCANQLEQALEGEDVNSK